MFKILFVSFVGYFLNNTCIANSEFGSCGRHFYCHTKDTFFLTADSSLGVINLEEKFLIQKVSLPEAIRGEITNFSRCKLICHEDNLVILVKDAFQFKIKAKNQLVFIKKESRPTIPESQFLIGPDSFDRELLRNDKFKIVLDFDHRESHVKTKYGDLTHFYKTKLKKVDLKTGKTLDELTVAEEERDESKE